MEDSWVYNWKKQYAECDWGIGLFQKSVKRQGVTRCLSLFFSGHPHSPPPLLNP